MPCPCPRRPTRPPFALRGHIRPTATCWPSGENAALNRQFGVELKSAQIPGAPVGTPPVSDRRRAPDRDTATTAPSGDRARASATSVLTRLAESRSSDGLRYGAMTAEPSTVQPATTNSATMPATSRRGRAVASPAISHDVCQCTSRNGAAAPRGANGGRSMQQWRHGDGFERGTDGPRVIVAAVDGSTTSMRAAAYAAGLARRQSAELVVVFVASGSTMANLVPAAGSAVDEAMHDVAADLRRTGRNRHGRTPASTAGSSRRRATRTPRSSRCARRCSPTRWWSARRPRPGTAWSVR